MHFLRKAELEGASTLRRPHAAVMVEVVERSVVKLHPGIIVAADDVVWVLLPERVQVLDPDDRPIRRDKHLRRLVSVNTFDPFHLVADVREAFL